MSTSYPTALMDEPPRAKLQALWRGFRGRCPQCGEGAMFRAYLKVNDTCPHCGAELHHQRADDAPPYVTMFIVGHVIVSLLLTFEVFWPEAPFWLEALVFCGMTAALSLILLPRVKGAFVALQWSLRMHGFGEAAPMDRSSPAI
ncbi:DUF983 domain-containing protein [Lichenifustis flavocetrariae]|uniref:DUF983 domain-containing protein n=1 Tax=Lichenifustis flavocetrariae TaxID=2949735 RepID=A0AA42CHZ6_9HYPH|nr:DUF983 domain-containing protein [Lichenifustis flavocetrariae]MCW6508058.1 DUF983 domain-containing protein [Lichenifustis flavocetrariae]